MSCTPVRQRSRDFRDKPRVDLKYFSDPYDMETMVKGFHLARKIVTQPAMAEWAGMEMFLGDDVRTDDELADFITRTHTTVYHPTGSIAMGAADDADALLDPQLRVKSVRVRGLRVADPSIVRVWRPRTPTSPSCSSTRSARR